jgi:hypothetical protein
LGVNIVWFLGFEEETKQIKSNTTQNKETNKYVGKKAKQKSLQKLQKHKYKSFYSLFAFGCKEAMKISIAPPAPPHVLFT